MQHAFKGLLKTVTLLQADPVSEYTPRPRAISGLTRLSIYIKASKIDKANKLSIFIRTVLKSCVNLDKTSNERHSGCHFVMNSPY